MLLAATTSSGHDHERIGRARITFYWIADESDPMYRASTKAIVRDERGKIIARTSPKFRKHLLLEGSGRTKDGRVLTYQRHINGEARFRVTRHQYGAGIGKCPLVPYRTIAVDPKFIPLGTRVYIPEFKGLRLPDGTIHDGMFMAHDRSASVRGAHIDIFTKTGRKSTWPFIEKGFHSGSRVTIYRADPPQPHGCQAR